MAVPITDQQSNVIVHGGRTFFSGITANDFSGDIRAQTHEAFEILDARLAEVGSDRSQVLTAHIWLSDMALFRDMTSVWNAWVDDDNPPSRSCVSGQSTTPGARLEVVATAALPNTGNNTLPIQRYGLVSGPGRPTMCLGLGYGDWYTVCVIAPDCTVGIDGQTQQILQMFDEFLGEAGTDKSKLLTAEIWLKRMSDLNTVNEIWNAWVDPSNCPAVSCVRADMAQPEMLIEIRITAAR